MTAVPPADQHLPPSLADLVQRFPDVQTGVSRDGKPWIHFGLAHLLPGIQWIKAQGYARFLDCTCVDEPSRSDRFELQYLLYSMPEQRWLRIKARTAAEAPSLTGVFAAADWYEREVFDLFGVRFQAHPDLRRILLPDDFEGPPPLRRDVPLGSEPIDFTVTRDLYGT